jgi:hypothetical protein
MLNQDKNFCQKTIRPKWSFMKLVPVVVAADTAVLALDGGGRHDLDEVSIESEPHAEEGVDVVGGAPAEDPVGIFEGNAIELIFASEVVAVC